MYSTVLIFCPDDDVIAKLGSQEDPLLALFPLEDLKVTREAEDSG